MQVLRTLTFYLKVIFQDYGTPRCLNFTNTLISHTSVSFNLTWTTLEYCKYKYSCTSIDTTRCRVLFRRFFWQFAAHFLHNVIVIAGITIFYYCSPDNKEWQFLLRNVIHAFCLCKVLITQPEQYIFTNQKKSILFQQSSSFNISNIYLAFYTDLP